MPSLSVSAVLRGHEGTVWSVEFSPNGTLLASCGQDKSIRIWQVEEGKCLTVLNEEFETHAKTVRRVAWRGDGNLLAAASFDGKTSIWEIGENPKFLKYLTGHENEVKCVAWSADGELIATCSRDKSLFVYDQENSECIAVLQGHTQDVKFCTFPSGTSDEIFSASYDETIKIWVETSPGEWDLKQTLRGHTSTVWALSFQEGGNRMLSAAGDGSVRLWVKGRANHVPAWLMVSPILRGALSDDGWRCISTLQGVHNRAVLDLHWRRTIEQSSSSESLDDMQLIATASADNTVRIIAVKDDHSFEQVTSFKLPTEINCVRWHPTNSRLLVVCSDDGLVRLLTLND